VPVRVEYVTACDGVRIAYAKRGRGRSVLWMPPLPARHLELEWEQPREGRWLEWLAGRYTLVQYDPRGLGLSDRAATTFTLDAFERDVHAVVERVAPDGVVLCAKVNAGPLAIAYAARHPERVSHLILWCATTRMADGIGPHLDALLALAERDWELFTLTAGHLVRGWSAGESADQGAALLRASMSPEVVPALVRDAFRIDVTDWLPLVRSPTLVMQRRGVTWVPMERAVELARSIPGARLVVLEGDSMAPWSGDMSAVAEAFDDFLGPAAPAEPVHPPTAMPSDVFRCEGEYWTLAFAGRVCRLRDAEGLHHIAYLLERPGEPVPASDLLDGRATSTSRRRRNGLRPVPEEVDRFNDASRAVAVRTEMEFIENHLTAAVELGGRDPGVAPAAERARLTVTKRVKGVLQRIDRQHPALAEHLARSIRTGVVCAYLPAPGECMRWSL
jgi:pimeloyl-ACP methyl ester carboxylesterase